MNIVEDIRLSSRFHPSNAAIIDGGVTLDYAALIKRVNALSERLKSNGIRHGEKVAFRCGDGLDYITGMLALLDTGAAAVPVDMSMPESEVARLTERIDVDGTLAEAASSDGQAPPINEPDSKQLKGTPFNYYKRNKNGRLNRSILELDPAFIRFSSGTTGECKGVTLSHKSIYERTEAANKALQVDENDRVLWVLSMSHHFVVSILLFLRKGATIVIGHRSFPSSISSAAGSADISLIYASPLHYHILATDPAIRKKTLKDVRLALSTAMMLPAETAHAFGKKFGFFPGEAYGIIEVGLPFIDTSPSTSSLGSVGRLLPDYEVNIENPDRNGIGEVMLRGKGMFDAYISPPRLRNEVLKNGWFPTGDLGNLDTGGNLRIAGRKKTVIICAGMKVFPEEVEEVINSHPAVENSLVYGSQHPVYGQIPMAEILPAGNKLNSETLQELRRFCYCRLPSYCVPKNFNPVSFLRRTSSGKLKRD